MNALAHSPFLQLFLGNATLQSQAYGPMFDDTPPHPPFSDVAAQARIVWISAGDERVGFETSKTEDADLMYQAICILVDRCHA